jgi:hypothetical protein
LNGGYAGEAGLEGVVPPNSSLDFYLVRPPLSTQSRYRVATIALATHRTRTIYSYLAVRCVLSVHCALCVADFRAWYRGVAWRRSLQGGSQKCLAH